MPNTDGKHYNASGDIAHPNSGGKYSKFGYTATVAPTPMTGDGEFHNEQIGSPVTMAHPNMKTEKVDVGFGSMASED